MRAIDLESLLKNLHVGSDHIANIMQYYREKNYEVDVRRRSDVVESLSRVLPSNSFRFVK